MLYQVLRPIPAYNNELETQFYVTKKGLKALFSKEYIKTTLYKMNKIKLSGNPLKDLEDLGYTVRRINNGVVHI